MLNEQRRRQYLELMEASGWDHLLLYGHSWRKDYFRSLININYVGPHAVAALSKSGEINVLFAHPWDQERIAGSRCDRNFGKLLQGFTGKIAVAGMELMEARFVPDTAVSATAAVEKIRLKKTPDEIATIRKAARLADDGYRHFVETVKVGLPEFELVAEVESFLKSRGAEDNFMLLASGGPEVFGMRPPTERRFQKGDCVTTELSPQVDGYYAQICRTLVVGQPSKEQELAFSIFQEAQRVAQEFLKPGVNIADLARVQNDVFRREGFGEYTGAKYTRVRGHNLGLHVDENPWVLEDVDCLVEKDMVLIAHPNTYLPMSGYMVFGDTLVVTEEGCVSLSQTEKKLFSAEAWQ